MNTSPDTHSILAVDIGTTSAKGLLVLPDGKVIGACQKFYNTFFPHPGFAEQDSDSIFLAVLEILKTITLNKNKPSGICFSAAMHSIMAVDENGNPLTNLIIWSDTRSSAQSSRLIEKKKAQQLYEITGTPVHPMSPLCKLLWMKENQPDIFLASYKFISIKEYILFRLTGDYFVDHSTASATGLFDLQERQWSSLALELLQLDKQKFSRTVPVLTLVTIKKEMADELQVLDVPLIVGASDGCLAQLGSHAMGNGDLSITLGTSGAVRAASRERKIDPTGRIFNYLLDDETFICGGATNCGTALLNWYSKNIDPSASDDVAEFVDQVEKISPGCEGLLMIPYLQGERAPVYNANARGVFFGVSIDHTKRHFQRALIEGICFQLRWITESVEDFFGSSKRILVSGGITRSENWVQLLCNVLGKSLIIQEMHDASAMGAAILGFRALDIQSSFTHLTTKVFRPDDKAHQVYSNSYRKYKELFAAVEKLYKS